MLESEGVGSNDRTVTLDGHDFACKSFEPVDFVTFDVDCYNGAKISNNYALISLKEKMILTYHNHLFYIFSFLIFDMICRIFK